MQSASNRVSVVIASNRSAPFLREAVATIRAQTHPVHEIVLVDDGAPTNGLRIAAEELGLRYLRQEPAGVSVAFNRGLAATDGELLTILGDDDVWHPDRIRLQIEALTRNPDAIGCYSGGWYLDADGHRFGTDWDGATASRADMISGVARIPVISTLLIRRDPLFACGGFHPAFTHGEDIELILRLLELGEFVSVDQPLFGYRRHSANVSSSRLDGFTGSLRLLQLHLWGAQAHQNPALERLVSQAIRRYGVYAGREAAHETLALLRRGHLRGSARAFAWSAVHRGLRTVPDLIAYIGSSVIHRVRSRGSDQR